MMHGGVKGRSDLRKARSSSANEDIEQQTYLSDSANDGDGAAFARHEPPAGTVQSSTQRQQQTQSQQPQRSAAEEPSPPTSNGEADATAVRPITEFTEVEGTGCTYILKDEIGHGAYGKVYLADVIHTDPVQLQLPVPAPPPPSLSSQLPTLRRSTGSGLVVKSTAANESNTNSNANSYNGNSGGMSNGHRNSCSNSSTVTAGRIVLKRMENASVEDGLQAATLREFMVLDEVSAGSYDRERAEIEAFRAGRVTFRATTAAAVAASSSGFVHPHDYDAFSSSDNNNNNTVPTDGKLEDELSTASATRNDDYLASMLRRRINCGRAYLLGMRDAIMLPHNQLVYIAMDYCEGGDLWHFIRDLKMSQKALGLPFGDAMPVKVFRRWAVELILALAFLHSRNISHRDLKPQNLMLAKRTDLHLRAAPVLQPPMASSTAAQSSEKVDAEDGKGKLDLLPGEQYSLKVGDFGLSRIEEIAYKKYVHEAVTLWYRSPDVLLGNTNYTFSADAWSLGCILVEMAAGSVFFKGRDEADELRHIFTRGCRPSLLNFPRLKEYPYAERFAEVLQKYRDTESEAKAATDGIDAEAALQMHVEKLARHLRAFLKERNAHNLLGVRGIDLVARLLIFDPERRFTVLQALRHRFFLEAYAEVYGPD